MRTLLEEQGLGEVRSVKLEEKRQNTRVYKTIVIPVQGTEYSAADGSGMCRIAERSAAGRVFESQPTKSGALLCQPRHVCQTNLMHMPTSSQGSQPLCMQILLHEPMVSHVNWQDLCGLGMLSDG